MNVTICRTMAELDAIASLWDTMDPESPHAARRLYTLVAGVESESGTAPYVAVLDGPGREPVLVVGRLEHRPLHLKAGYRTLMTVPARWLTIVPGGVVGARTPQDHTAVLDVLTEALRRGEADIVELSKLRVDSPVHGAAVQALPWYRRGQATEPQRHHLARLAGGFDAYEANRSRNTRQRNRRRLRRLDDPGAAMEVRRVGGHDDGGLVGKTLDEITASSYQRGIGAGFALDDLHRTLVSWAIDGGPFRIWILSVRGVPAAFVTGLVHGRICYLFDTAFDPAFSDDEPGGILMAKVMQELALDPDIDAFDFAFGDAQYKQSLSDESWDEVGLLVFAARPRALALNALRGAAVGAVAAAKRLLGGERVAALRRRMRSGLAGATPQADAEH
jgi:CelD/BcsL family acetyltransferase involved in cellulose biosynthesis